MSYNFIWENWFYSAIFVQYKCCCRHLCVRFYGKIMPDSVSTKWHIIIGTSNFFKTEIFAHSYNPIIIWQITIHKKLNLLFSIKLLLYPSHHLQKCLLWHFMLFSNMVKFVKVSETPCLLANLGTNRNIKVFRVL